MLNKEYYNRSASEPFLAPESIDLFITHPPYFNTHQDAYGNAEDQLQNTTDREVFVDKIISVIKHMEMALKDSGTILILFPTDQNIYKIIEKINTETSLKYGPLFFWDFTNSPHVKEVTGKENNIILNLHKGSQMVNTSYKVDTHTLAYPWILSDKLKSNSHVAFINDSAPEMIYELLINRYSKPGDVVADIMAGTGSALAVAKRLGRQTVYNDVSAEQLKLAKIIIDDEPEIEIDLKRKEIVDLMTKEIIDMNIQLASNKSITDQQAMEYAQQTAPELNRVNGILYDLLMQHGVIK